MRVTRMDDLKLPKMRMIEQRLNVLPPVNVPEEIDREWNRLINSLVLSPGLKVAVAVGSRGIADLCTVVRSIIQKLKEAKMKKFIIILMAGLAVLALMGNSEASSKDTFSVMTFNIRVGVGMVKPGTPPNKLKKSPKILDSIAKAIKFVDPDVLGLQEVQGKKQAKKLAKALNMNYVYKRHGSNKYTSWWGVAILSKYNIIESKNYTVYSGGYMPWRARTLIESTIDIKGKKIAFFNAHFRHQGNALKKQPKYIMKKISKSKNPLILLGDLNMLSDDPRFKPIKGKLKDSCEAVKNKNSDFIKANGTYLSPNDPKYANRRIDYIFYDPKFFRVIDVGLLNKKYWNTSDHIGYFSRIELM
ncbi:hypothetical protein LCGC14_1915370 [marine sediment metagenome]|uniref:Endonuclease/exonuclease/phosphatase domain-containing protein n=1 Tax=marine sediment metagenome TaxID=412755 RepID=A0A0F9IQD5_9ZZZZ